LPPWSDTKGRNARPDSDACLAAWVQHLKKSGPFPPPLGLWHSKQTVNIHTFTSKDAPPTPFLHHPPLSPFLFYNFLPNTPHYFFSHGLCQITLCGVKFSQRAGSVFFLSFSVVFPCVKKTHPEPQCHPTKPTHATVLCGVVVSMENPPFSLLCF